jgi:hypothetical protein
MSTNLSIKISSPVDINNLKNSRLFLHKEGQSGSYQLGVLNKNEWTKLHRSHDSGYINNLGKIIEIVNEAKIESVSSNEKMAIMNRLNEASQKHNLRFCNVQWLKFLFIPWVLAKIFHWSVFDK